jgi:hypothetical protein
MENMEKLGKESVINIKNTIDFILDDYKGTKKQITYLKSLSEVLTIEEEILKKIEKYKSLRNKLEQEHLLDEIDTLLGSKQKICMDTLKKVKKNI